MDVTVDATFLASPPDDGNLNEGDDTIRATRVADYERRAVEHIGKTSETQATHGIHRKGSAICYYQAAAPTLRPDGVTALTDADQGRLWLDTDTDILYVYKGTVTGWFAINSFATRISISGFLAVGNNIVLPIIFPQATAIVSVMSKLGTAPTGTNDVRFDLRKNGTDSIFTAGYVELGDTTVDTETNLTAHATLTAGDYLTVDIEQIGTTQVGRDLSIVLLGGPA
jgi:hypothetical protein